MLKYKKCAVDSLSDQALITFGCHLVKSLSNQNITKETLDVSSIKEYFNLIGATSRIRQNLLDLISMASSSMILSTVHLACFRLLLDESTSVFGAEMSWDTSYRKFWKIMAQQCTGLRVLDLRNTHLPAKKIHYFEEILKNNKKLTTLYLPYISHSEMVEIRKIIKKNCKQLKFLGSPDYIDVTIEANFLCTSNFAHSLTIIDLPISAYIDMEIHTDAIAQILACCPNVETLTDYANVGAALFKCHNKIKNFKCNLRKVCDTDTNSHHIEIIFETCPKLEKLHLYHPIKEALNFLKKPILSELLIEQFDCSEFMTVLKRIGQNLISLILRETTNRLNMRELVQYCPILIKLEFEYLTNDQVDQMCNLFDNLKELKINKSSISLLKFAKLFSYSEELQVLHIDQFEFDDYSFEIAFGNGIFENLIEFRIHHAPLLTARSIRMLMQYCPKLQRIGTISDWNLNNFDINSLTCLRQVDEPQFQQSLKNIPYGPIVSLLLK